MAERVLEQWHVVLLDITLRPDIKGLQHSLFWSWFYISNKDSTLVSFLISPHSLFRVIRAQRPFSSSFSCPLTWNDSITVVVSYTLFENPFHLSFEIVAVVVPQLMACARGKDGDHVLVRVGGGWERVEFYFAHLAKAQQLHSFADPSHPPPTQPGGKLSERLVLRRRRRCCPRTQPHFAERIRNVMLNGRNNRK